MKDKEKLPPMPEHDGTDNCPACAEAQRIIKEMETTPLMERFKKLAPLIEAEHAAIEKEFGIKMNTVFAATFENEQTERIGTSPIEILVKTKNRQGAVDLLREIHHQTVMPEVKAMVDKILGEDNSMKPIKNHHGNFFMGKPGEA